MSSILHRKHYCGDAHIFKISYWLQEKKPNQREKQKKKCKDVILIYVFDTDSSLDVNGCISSPVPVVSWMMVLTPAITILSSFLSFILVYHFCQKKGTYRFLIYIFPTFISKQLSLINHVIHLRKLSLDQYICKGTLCGWVLLCNDAVFIFVDKEPQILQERIDISGQTRRNQVMISKIKSPSASDTFSSYLFVFEVVWQSQILWYTSTTVEATQS